jgi:hypothetical protein
MKQGALEHYIRNGSSDKLAYTIDQNAIKIAPEMPIRIQSNLNNNIRGNIYMEHGSRISFPHDEHLEFCLEYDKTDQMINVKRSKGSPPMVSNNGGVKFDDITVNCIIHKCSTTTFYDKRPNGELRNNVTIENRHGILYATIYPLQDNIGFRETEYPLYQISQTITHATNVIEQTDDHIGCFCESVNEIYDGYDKIGPTDCICKVRPTTELSETTIGIISGKNTFATHGDVLVRVDATASLKPGDILKPGVNGAVKAEKSDMMFMTINAIPRAKITCTETGIKNMVACVLV